MNSKIKKYLYPYWRLGVAASCLVLCILLLVLLLPKSKASSKPNVEVMEPIIEEKEPIIEETVIRVDIKGAVANPGVYEMKESARVNDVIYQAGGVLETADLSRINLSKHVTDEMVIIVYTKEEINALNNPPEQIEYVYIEPECKCPDTVNDACISPKEEPNLDTQKISINTATKEELETLPGVGASKADAIIEYRNQKKFETLEELKEIKGIGESVFEKLKDYITL